MLFIVSSVVDSGETKFNFSCFVLLVQHNEWSGLPELQWSKICNTAEPVEVHTWTEGKPFTAVEDRRQTISITQIWQNSSQDNNEHIPW